MRTIVALVILLSLGYNSPVLSQGTDHIPPKGMEMQSNMTENSQKLRHLVFFKFKDSVTQDDIVTVEKAFSELPSKIEQIKGFEWGINNSPENLNKGFTHGFLLTFKSEEDREIYLPHPDHKLFVQLLEPLIEDVLVFDYFSKTQ